MSIFVIADLHLDTESNQKSMEVFGNRWVNYVYKLKKNWERLVTSQDTVIVPGDISWALTLNDAIPDLRWIHELPGRKILMKGNHDFWWSTASKMNKMFEEQGFTTIELLSNNALEVENYIVAGSRGWFTDKSMQNSSQTVDYQKIINREVIRLKMSLDHAKKLRETSGKEILTFLHFPPIWSDFLCQEILDLLEEYQIQRCFFGHIHSCYTAPASFVHNGIQFRMISADYLDFIPQIL
ncbi:MAG: metallophosphoesterase [Clostridia bacterium]|nr:metallophosphoesterase [Clostridia bacterium]